MTWHEKQLVIPVTVVAEKGTGRLLGFMALGAVRARVVCVRCGQDFNVDKHTCEE